MAISKRTFYKHFSGRDQLVSAVILDIISPVGAELMANLDSPGPARDIIDRHFDLLLNRLLPRIPLRFFADVQDLMPETWELVENFRRQAVEKLVTIIRRGQHEGTIRADVSPEVVGGIIQGVMASVANPAFALTHGMSLPEIGKTLHAIIYRGMLPEARHE